MKKSRLFVLFAGIFGMCVSMNTGLSAATKKNAVEKLTSADKTLTIRAENDGLHITKKHAKKFTHVTLHIVQQDGSENVGISTDEKTNDFIYPFVKAGEQYTVYLTMMTADWGNWTQTKSVQVTAAGGLGDYAVLWSDFSYDNETCSVIFADFSITAPAVTVTAEQVSGNVYYNNNWSDIKWGHFSLDKAAGTLDLSEQAALFQNKTFFIQADYNFYYKGHTYTARLLQNDRRPFTDVHQLKDLSVSAGILRPPFSPAKTNFIITGTDKTVTVTPKLIDEADADKKNLTLEPGQSAQILVSYGKKQTAVKLTYEKPEALIFTDSTGKTERYIRTFYDDFSGTELDGTKWKRSFEQERQGSMKGHGWWKNDCSYIKDGNLIIESRLQDGTPVSGSVETSGIFEQSHGIYEIRFKCENTSGMWYAFWLMDDNNDEAHVGNGATDAAEIDIFELVPNEPYNGPHFFKTTVNYDAYGTAHKAVSSPGADIDRRFYDEWHTALFVWGEQSYELYLDGTLLWVMDGEDYGGMCNGTNYMIISAEFGDWGGNIEESLLPARMYVDYVKAYRKAE